MSGHGRAGVGRARCGLSFWPTTGATTLVVGGVVAGLLAAPSGRLDAPIAPSVALAVGFAPTGLFLLRARPGHLGGQVMSVVGVLALVALACWTWSSVQAAAWATQWTWWPPLALVPLTLLVHPDGRLGSRRRLLLAVVVLGAGVSATAGLAAAALSAPTSLVTGGSAAPAAAKPWLVGATVAGFLVLGGTLAAVADMVARARRADREVRSQIVCLLPVGALLVLGVSLDAAGVPYATVPGILALPVGIGVAIIGYRLDDLDLLVNRSVVWAVMSLAILAVFAASVALLSSTVLRDRPLVASALGTGLVAAGFDPLRRRVQAGADRFLFGDRNRPQEVLLRLGRRMQSASEPRVMLSDFVQTLGPALRVPFVRMTVESREGVVLTAVEHGRRQADLVSFPLVAHGEGVGHLEVAPRRTGEVFTRREQELLREVSGQAATAARSYRMTLDLQRAREVLVRTREEERLRLRRDLHDELGPALTGTRMQLVAARTRLPDSAAAELVDSSLEVLAECTAEVRRLVDGLRPPALDQGLATAVGQRAAALLEGLDGDVLVEGDLDGLPPAVEVAAYRIVTEALTNAVRHSGATRVDVRLARGATDLEAVVSDDGRGRVAARPDGVGLESMAARAEELGGSVELLSSDRGLTVRARLPL